MRLRWHHVDYYALASMKQQQKQDRRTLPCPKIVDGQEVVLCDDIPAALFQLLMNDNKHFSHAVEVPKLPVSVLPKSASASVLSRLIPQEQAVSKVPSFGSIELMLESNGRNDDAEPGTPSLVVLEEPAMQDTDIQKLGVEIFQGIGGDIMPLEEVDPPPELNVRPAENDADLIAIRPASLKNQLTCILESDTTCAISANLKHDKLRAMEKFCPMDLPCILDEPIAPSHFMTDPSSLMNKIALMKASNDTMANMLKSRADMMSLLGPDRMATDDVKPTYKEALCEALEEANASADCGNSVKKFRLLDVPFPSLSQSPMGGKLATELICKEKKLHVEALPSKSVSMKDFNELVVAPQLTLDCGGLKSLPVPLLQEDSTQGDPNVLSASAFLSVSDSVKANSTMASRARYFLYLDWHLSQDFKTCTSSSCTEAGGKLSFQKVQPLLSKTPQPVSLFSLINDTVRDAPGRVILKCENTLKLPPGLVQKEAAVPTTPAVATPSSSLPRGFHFSAAAQQQSQPGQQLSYAERQTSPHLQEQLPRYSFVPSPQPQSQPSLVLPPPISRMDLSQPRSSPIVSAPSPTAVTASAATAAAFASAAAAAVTTATASPAAVMRDIRPEERGPLPVSTAGEGGKRVGFQRQVQKMSSELNFFLNARQGKGRSLQQEPPQEVADPVEPSIPAENAYFQPHDTYLVKEGHVDNRLQAAAAVSPLTASRCLEESVRQLHRVQMSLDLTDILDVAKEEYQNLQWSLSSEVRASVKPFRLNQDVTHSIKEEISRQKLGQPVQDRLLQPLKCLYLLHQSAMLCWQYGIRVAHLFLEQGLEAASIAHFVSRIRRTRDALASAFELVEGGATVDHPKLSVLTSILRAHKKGLGSSTGCNNVLIISDSMTFFTMYKLLGTCQFRPFQLGRLGALTGVHGKVVAEEKWEIVQREVNEALESSDCILVSPKYLVPSFPISKFSVVIIFSDIVQDQNLPLLNSISGKVHILAVEDPAEPPQPEIKTIPSQAKKGLDPKTATTDQDAGPRRDKPETPTVILLDSEPDYYCNEGTAIAPEPRRQHPALIEEDAPPCAIAEEAPDFATEQDVWGQAGHLQHQSVNLPEQKKPAVEYKRSIIVNTREQFGPIVLRRRHLYDKILQLEESGIQILERDLLAPAEVVLSASSCLIIYNHQRLTDVQRLAAMDGLPSSSLMNVCLEAVVETHLKALSFAYQSCFLVFEGTDTFLAQIKHHVDDLYAGGAALDLNVQCFFSSSEDSTANPILRLLSSVPASTEPSGAQPPRAPLPESESPQEAFLCRFPSLNPLSAHIILTSGPPLPVFMCLHHEKQVSATLPRGFPARSLTLFQAQCEKETSQHIPAHMHPPLQGSRNSPPSEGNMYMQQLPSYDPVPASYSAVQGHHRDMHPRPDGQMSYGSRHERPAAPAYMDSDFPPGRRSRSPPEPQWNQQSAWPTSSEAETLVLSDDDDDVQRPGQHGGERGTYRGVPVHQQEHRQQQNRPQQRALYGSPGAPEHMIAPVPEPDGYSFGGEPNGGRSFPSVFELEQAGAASAFGGDDSYFSDMPDDLLTGDFSSSHHSASPSSSSYFPGATDSGGSSQPASAASGVRSALQGWMSRRPSAGNRRETMASSSFQSEAQPAATRGNPYGSMSSSPQLSRYSGQDARSGDGRPSRPNPQQVQRGRAQYHQQQPMNPQGYRPQAQQLQYSPNQESWASPPAPRAFVQPQSREQSNKRACASIFRDETGRREEADANLQKFRHTGSKIPRHVLVKRKLQGMQTPVQAGSSASKAEESRLSWTPSDKRAKEVLAYERAEGDAKQCKLVWKKPRTSLD